MEHAAHPPAESLTHTAVRATLHCLIGCAIGEVLGMVTATAHALTGRDRPALLGARSQALLKRCRPILTLRDPLAPP